MLSNTAEYALRITITLAEAGDESLTSAQIAEATKVPVDYAVKVLQRLGQVKIVHGQRGRKGGFRLACDPLKTTLLDVVNVIDPLERITTCPLGRKQHRHKLCPLHSRLDEVIGILADSLGDMTIQSVVEGQTGPALCRTPNAKLRVSAKAASSKRTKKIRR
jgi:Rrf2 family protein